MPVNPSISASTYKAMGPRHAMEFCPQCKGDFVGDIADEKGQRCGTCGLPKGKILEKRAKLTPAPGSVSASAIAMARANGATPGMLDHIQVSNQPISGTTIPENPFTRESPQEAPEGSLDITNIVEPVKRRPGRPKKEAVCE